MGMAFAGGYVAPVVNVEPVDVHPTEALSWSGFYAGGLVGKQKADLEAFSQKKVSWSEKSGAVYESVKQAIDDSATTYGLFAGYRHHYASNLVAGVEGSYTKTGKLFDGVGVKAETWGVEAQLGFAMQRALPYVAVGYADVDGESATSYSLGVDYALTDKIMIGAKYTKYDIGEIKGVENFTKFKADSDLVSIRAAYRF